MSDEYYAGWVYGALTMFAIEIVLELLAQVVR